MKQPTRRDGLKAMAAGAALAGLSGVEAVAAGPAAPLADLHGSPRHVAMPGFRDGDPFSITLQRRVVDRIFSEPNIPTDMVKATYVLGDKSVNWTCTRARRHSLRRRRLTLRFDAVGLAEESERILAPGTIGELTITVTDPESDMPDTPVTIEIEQVDVTPC